MMACLDRRPRRRAEPAHRTLAGLDVAAMRAGGVARDRKRQHGAAFFPVAGIVALEERKRTFCPPIRPLREQPCVLARLMGGKLAISWPVMKRLL
jgi:hypothetical protein